MDPKVGLPNAHVENMCNKNYIFCDSTNLGIDKLGYLNEEKNRLLSFNSWPARYPVDPSRLAKSGFYYSGKGDEVICFSCNGCLNNWQYGTIVQKRHKESFPHCEFVNGKSNNVPFLQGKLIPPEDIESLSKKEHTPENESCINLKKSYRDSSSLTFDSLNSNSRANSMSVVSCNRGKFACIDVSKMISEKERYKTFYHRWPLSLVPVDLLVEAGFFYLGCEDKVQCAFCYGIVKNWHIGDVPLEEHEKHFPNCPYIQKHKKSTHDDCDSECHQNVPVATPSVVSHKLLNQAHQHTLEQFGVNVYHAPKHPQLATFSARFQSFASWPETGPVSKEVLAAAGFFYIGVGDRTKCFHCDGGLHCWENGDDPWIEHAKWFQNCSFLRLNKGVTFINAAQNHGTESQSLKRSEDIYVKKTSSAHPDAVNSSNILEYKAEKVVESDSCCSLQKTVSSSQLVKLPMGQHLHENEVSQGLNEACKRSDSPNEALKYLKSGKNSSDGSDSGCESSENQSQSSVKYISTDIMESKQNVNKILLGGVNDFWSCIQTYKDHSALEDRGLCKVCMDNEINIAFLPCGHVLTCTDCASALSECPTCLQGIQATVRVYIP